jgi:hypothetical protein
MNIISIEVDLLLSWHFGTGGVHRHNLETLDTIVHTEVLFQKPKRRILSASLNCRAEKVNVKGVEKQLFRTHQCVGSVT